MELPGAASTNHNGQASFVESMKQAQDAFQSAMASISVLRAEAEEEKRRYRELCQQVSCSVERASEIATQSSTGFAHFNVGGERFTVSLGAIDTLPTASVLGALLHGTFPVDRDDEGFILIDRSPITFGLICDYLRLMRDEMASVPPSSCSTTGRGARPRRQWALQAVQRRLAHLHMLELSALREDAEFFGISELSMLALTLQHKKWLKHFPFTEPMHAHQLLDVKRSQLRRAVGDRPSSASLQQCRVSVLCAAWKQDHSCLPATRSGSNVKTLCSRWLVVFGCEDGSMHCFALPSQDAAADAVNERASDWKAHSGPIVSVAWLRSETSDVVVSLSKEGVIRCATLDISFDALGEKGMSLHSLKEECSSSSGGTSSAPVSNASSSVDLTSLFHKHEFGRPTSIGVMDSSSRPCYFNNQQEATRRYDFQNEEHVAVGFDTGVVVLMSLRVQLLSTARTVAMTVARIICNDRRIDEPVRCTHFLSIDRDTTGAHNDTRITLFTASGARVDRYVGLEFEPTYGVLDAHTEGIRCIASSESTLATGCLGGQVFLWDLDACITSHRVTPRAVAETLCEWVSCLQFDHVTGWLLASAGTTLYIMDAHNGSIMRRMQMEPAVHQDLVRCFVLLQPTILITASYDGTIRVWDGESACGELCPLCSHAL